MIGDRPGTVSSLKGMRGQTDRGRTLCHEPAAGPHADPPHRRQDGPADSRDITGLILRTKAVWDPDVLVQGASA